MYILEKDTYKIIKVEVKTKTSTHITVRIPPKTKGAYPLKAMFPIDHRALFEDATKAKQCQKNVLTSKIRNLQVQINKYRKTINENK